MDRANKYASPEELRYAKILDAGAKAGLLLLVAGFLLYVSGGLPSRVVLAELPRYWGLAARQYAAATHTPAGWGWLGLIGYCEALNLLAIAFLAGVSVVGTLFLVRPFARRGDIVHAVLAALQVVVLLFAASGLHVAGS